MRRIDEPRISAEESYTTAINNVKDASFAKRLSSISSMVVAASDAFEAASHAGTVCQIRSAESVGTVSGKELEDIYSQRFAGTRSPGRPIYDQLLMAAPDGRCPLCGFRQASTLDHFLPKSKHPALAVAPLNLVPACKDCNQLKRDATPSTEETVTLHPYFDDIDGDRWLHADVLATSPASVGFMVLAPAHWDPVLTARVQHHFKTFKIATL